MFQVKSLTEDPVTGLIIELGTFTDVDVAKQTIRDYFSEKAQSGNPSTLPFIIVDLSVDMDNVFDTLYPFDK